MAQSVNEAILDIKVNYAEALSSIAKYRKELEQTKADIKGLDKSSEDYGKELAALKNKEKALSDTIRVLNKEVQNEVRQRTNEKGSLTQLRAELSNLTKQYDNLSRKERETGKAGAELKKKINDVTKEIKNAEQGTQRFYRNVGNYTKSISASLLGFTSVATAAVAGVVALGNALKNGIQTAMQFQSATSKLASIMQTSKNDISALIEQSKELGASTKYTATEVAELQTELAKLGYTKNDILNMTESVLYLGQATDASLGDAASMVGAALRMFGDNTQHTQEYVDKLAASTTNSALSFDYLNTALSIVGPVANSFGFKLEDVLALLGQLANAGFDASSAATATRNIFLNLADTNGDLAKSLGHPVTNLKDLTDGLRELNDKGINLNEALKLTDKRSVAAFSSFLKAADGADQLKESLQNCDGAAEEMAHTMQDNLQGDITSLGSAWDGLMISINNSQGMMRTATQWLTGMVRGLSDWLASAETIQNKYASGVAKKYGAGSQYMTTLTNGDKRNYDTLVKQYKEAGNTQAQAEQKAYNNLYAQLTKMQNNYRAKAEQAMEVIKQYEHWGHWTDADLQRFTNPNISSKTDADIATKLLKARKDQANYSARSTAAGARIDALTGSQSTGTSSEGAGIQTTSEQAAAAKAAEKAANEQAKANKDTLKQEQEYENTMIALIADMQEKQRKIVEAKYDHQIQDLQLKLTTEKNLTAQGRDAINKTIELKEQQKQQELDKLTIQQAQEDVKNEQEKINLKLAAVVKGSDEELKLKQESIDKQEEAEWLAAQASITNTEELEQRRLLIESKYAKIRKDLMVSNERDKFNKQKQILENQYNQQLMDAHGNDLKQLELKKQYTEKVLNDLIARGQLEGETEEEFNREKLQANQEYLSAKEELANKEKEIDQAKYDMMSNTFGGLSDIFDELGDSNKKFAKLSKALALGEIAVNTGKALAFGVADAMQSGWPACIPVLATLIATITANIASAISTVKSAKFSTGGSVDDEHHYATGGSVRGAGSGTSDSISAKLSNGESVMNAAATSMFSPILSAFNQMGGGVPINVAQSGAQAIGEEMLARAVARGVAAMPNPVVSVEEINKVNTRVSALESLSTI